MSAFLPDFGSCSATMTLGTRKTSTRGRKQASYTNGSGKQHPCPSPATRILDGKPYCAMHAPADATGPLLKRINGCWMERHGNAWVPQYTYLVESDP